MATIANCSSLAAKTDKCEEAHIARSSKIYGFILWRLGICTMTTSKLCQTSLFLHNIDKSALLLITRVNSFLVQRLLEEFVESFDLFRLDAEWATESTIRPKFSFCKEH